MKRSIAALLLAASLPLAAATPADVAAQARQYRTARESQILDELVQFLAIPNLARDAANIERNAQAIVAMFAKRNVPARLLTIEGAPPIVVADLKAPGAKKTIAFYAHYDGQPADPSQWETTPWTPVMKEVRGEKRIYARSASDDKGPIVAMLAAIDALRASKIAPAVNLRFVFEGEEEAGSPHLAQYLERFATDLAADAWMLCDGPVHQSGRQLLYFGARGVTDVELTVYGPGRALHSGHYGNWAPNPIVTLMHLLTSMRDNDGRILIEDYDADVRPLTAVEKEALAAAPPYDREIQRELALGRTEGKETLNERILLPALNLRGFSGGRVAELASNSIPTEARASIDFRLVPAQTPERVHELVERHIAKKGFHIVRDLPDAATRQAHPNVIRVEWGHGYPAARTPMDSAVARQVTAIVREAAGHDPVRLPSLGGSIPMYLFQAGGKVPVIGVPIVNHDNNQHAANENLRLQNLWNGIEIFAALFAGLK
jgi:acetylornithine deacetylase/succinyl-diaminopimelate desuccinylase-like protein